jgi:hypothetical protein
MLIHSRYFRISATFEMRTALCEIHLFNDKLVMHDRVFTSKQIMWGESKTAERQKERVCEIQCVAGNENWRRQ